MNACATKRAAEESPACDRCRPDRCRWSSGYASRAAMAGFLGLLADDADGVGGIVAADIVERVDRVRLEDLENLLAIFEVGLVARRAERGRGRRGDRLEIGDRLLPEIDELLVDDAAHAMQRAIDSATSGKSPRLQHHAGQRLVDHRRRPASLGDKDFVRHDLSLPFASVVGRTAPARLKALGAERVMRKPGAAPVMPRLATVGSAHATSRRRSGF